MSNPNWWNQAACKGEPLATFFPEKGGKNTVLRAKAICTNCTVTVQCLEDTLKAEQPDARHGVFGGLSSAERSLMFGSVRYDEMLTGEMQEEIPLECSVV